MKQSRNHSLASLLAAGAHASAGAGEHGATLDLSWGSQAAINAVRSSLISARDTHATAMTQWVSCKRALRIKKAATYDLLFGSRDLLKRVLGKQYSTAWHGTGFINSLEIPRSVPRLQNLAGTLKAYLTAHPELERADLMTAAMLDVALAYLTAAQNAVTLQKSIVAAALTNRRRAEKALRLQLRWLVQELTRVLAPMDDRWTAFGLNKPGLKQTPSIPQNVTVTVMENNARVVKWEKTPRAQYFRVWIRVEGTDSEMRPVGTPSDLNFMFDDLPAQLVVEVAVSAINNGGESALSEVVRLTTV